MANEQMIENKILDWARECSWLELDGKPMEIVKNAIAEIFNIDLIDLSNFKARSDGCYDFTLTFRFIGYHCYVNSDDCDPSDETFDVDVSGKICPKKQFVSLNKRFIMNSTEDEPIWTVDNNYDVKCKAINPLSSA